MDHIREDFNVPQIWVKNVATLERYSPPSSWVAFHDFVKERGWALDQDYKLVISADENLELLSKHEVYLGPLLQAWLFFGLIFTVVQQAGQSILTYDDLVTEDKKYVTTEKLNRAIQKWERWEFENKSGIQLRMIRTEKILDIARRVTRRNCSNDRNERPWYPYGGPLYVADSLSLSLMVLGETLSAAKAHILERTGSELRGWHRNDGEGWGQPHYVWLRMYDEHWCPRTIYLWRNQLRSNATLLLASYYAYQETSRFRGTDHIEGKCNNHNCFVKPVNKAGEYQPAHAANCNRDCGEMQGPNMIAVRELLNEKPDAKIPLLQFKEDPTDASVIQLTVLPQTEEIEYATLSHVWSDGFGNEIENKLYPCQLRFIWRQLRSLGDGERPFWMDTLIIPVAQDHRDMRKLAIGQIMTVFRESSFTIVLDGGLTNLPPGVEDKPAHAAMRILASSWMRRLWTLQEAFVSNKIHFSFREAQEPGNYLREFTDVSVKLDSSGAGATTALLKMLNEHLKHRIIGHERGTRRKSHIQGKSGLHGKEAAALIANIWKAAKWRTTTNPYHETLALASLLNLDYQNAATKPAGVGQTSPLNLKPGQVGAGRTGKTDELMVQFWTQFNDRWPHSIPPGIIFLQGERIDQPGFGWAPRTWMSADPLEAADPLGTINSPAGLNTTNQDGLRVSYPGFLLISQNIRRLLGTNKTRPRVWFPTGPDFLDWYVVEPADSMAYHRYLMALIEDPKPLAIILPCSKSDLASADTGLLVRIRKVQITNHGEPKTNHTALSTASSSDGMQPYEQDLGNEENQRIFFCEIIHRVKIWRETQPQFHAVNRGRFFEDYEVLNGVSHIPEIMTNPEMDDEICVAEELDSSQVWYVDGYFPNREQPEISTGSQLPLPNSAWLEKFDFSRGLLNRI